jgi:transposase InsO family protein
VQNLAFFATDRLRFFVALPAIVSCAVHPVVRSASLGRVFPHSDSIARHGMLGSMGRVGAAGGNAAMESFFSLLQNNVLDRRTWSTRDELRAAIVHWIERTYHRRRRQDRLGRLTPIEFETIINHEAPQAT